MDRLESLFDMEMDCQMSPAYCSQINDGITYLENHANADCRQRGSAARGRYNAIGFGYRYGNPNIPLNMYTNWQWNPLTQTWTNGNTYVNTSGFVLLQEQIAGLLAHEEVHHMGQDDDDHTQGVAVPTQNTCTES